MRKTLPHFILLTLISCILWTPFIVPTTAQPPGWGGDENLYIKMEINNQSVIGNVTPIPILTNPDFYYEVQVANNLTLNHISFQMVYMGFPFPVQTFPVDYDFISGQTFNQSQTLDLSAFLNVSGLGTLGGSLTGIFSFNYTLQGATNSTVVSEQFTLLLGPQGAAALTTIPGLITVGFTVMAVFSLLLSLDEFQRGIFAARKLRGAKSASDVGIFPPQVVLRRKPKKKQESETIGKDELVRRVEAAAKNAWDGKRCPKCGKKWKSDSPTCSKCKITKEQAISFLSEDIAQYAPKALDIVKPKSKITVGKLSKRLRLKPDKGGALAAALTDMDVFHTKSVKVPLKKVAFSGMTLSASYFSWMQLIGGQTPSLIDVLLLTAGGLVVSVLIGYLMNWLARVPRLGNE